ncbi:hypothetical protein NN761_04835 [Bacteroides clarus]|uniref:hypothetical protein n=1 Tax=Bacteroides clarus TaxID=626929 RepID=UPI0021018C8F|nr:hypothetical protein [Bacteroides clarus]MCQ1544895.1 hypothetical protein [Bacteroides clarus]
MENTDKEVSLQCVFHSIRFKVNKKDWLSGRDSLFYEKKSKKATEEKPQQQSSSRRRRRKQTKAEKTKRTPSFRETRKSEGVRE